MNIKEEEILREFQELTKITKTVSVVCLGNIKYIRK